MSWFRTGDGLKLHYEDSGTGQPVICLPGLTRNARDFDWMAARLDGPRLIRLTARGRGLSDPAPDHGSYNVLRETQDVAELMAHLDLPRAAFIGTSRGGLVAMTLAAQAAERVAGILLNDVGPVIETNGIARIIEYVGRDPDWPDLESAAAGLQAAMQDSFPDVPLDVWRHQAAAQYIETPDGLDLRYDRAIRTALLEQAAAGLPPDLWPLFDALPDMPLAVLRGARSDVLSRETVAEMRRRRPDLIATEIPDRGHAPFLDEPASLAALHAFLEMTR